MGRTAQLYSIAAPFPPSSRQPFTLTPETIHTLVQERIRAEAETLGQQKKKQDTPQPQPAQSPVAGLALRCAASIEPEPVDWIWPGRIAAGVLHVLDGMPGVGKSMFTCYLAATLSTGGRWPDGSRIAPGNVILVNLEDDLARTLRPRLDAAGADVSRVFLCDDAQDVITLPSDTTRMEAAIRAHSARMVVIDPLMAVLESKVNSYRDQDIRRVLSAIKAVCGRTGCAVVLVRHLNKAAGGPAMTRGGGSIGIVGAARLGLLMAQHPQDGARRVLAIVKSNLGSCSAEDTTVWGIAEGPRLEYLGREALSADEILAALDQQDTRQPGRPPEIRHDADAWLRDVLANGPVLSSDLKARAQAAGFKWRTIERIKKDSAESYRDGADWMTRLRDASQEDRQYSLTMENWRSRFDSDGIPLENNGFQDRQNPTTAATPPERLM